MKPLVLQLRVYDDDSREVLRILKESNAEPRLVKILEREIEIARDGALEVRANWELGIAQSALDAE